MKLVTFHYEGAVRLGWSLPNDGIVLLVDAQLTGGPETMIDLIGAGRAGLDQLRRAKDQLRPLPQDELRLLPPVPDPRGIFCVGLNYAEHEREAPVAGSDYPTIFLRLARNQVAHGAPMITPLSSQTLDWEGELVAVIGTPGRHIAPQDALDHVFGYSIYNEASVRAFQHHSSQFGMGKNFEATGAFGPCVITADAFGDPYAQRIETTIDGETVQAAPIDDMLHRIEDVIAYISSATWLQPGDLILTGTPSGVGAARQPQRFLQDGETVSVTVSGIGTLTNPVNLETRAEARLR